MTSEPNPRVVSLVPSASETLVALGVPPVACTRFCDQPGIGTVGGTKNPDVEAIVALHPDLVVVNDEENRRADADALTAAGLAVHSMSPRSLAAVGPAVGDLAAALRVATPEPFGTQSWLRWLDRLKARREQRGRRRGVVMVWRRPWMTLNRDTYGSSLLEGLGIENVFARSPERYPETTLEVVAARRADLVLLPDEPYRFGPRHLPEVTASVPDAHVLLVDGRDLFWWGIRTPDAVDRLQTALGR